MSVLESDAPAATGVLADFEVLLRHGDNPSGFLALNEGTERMRVDGIDGFVAFRPAGRRHLIQLGGVFADPSDQDELLGHFLDLARQQKKKVVSIQLQRQDAERYAARGFTVNQFGASYAVSLDGFSLAGKAHMRLRNKISRARRSGLVIREFDTDLPDDVLNQLDSIDHTWLRTKGRHAKELRFMVGERAGPGALWRRLFVAADGEGRVMGYVTFSPVGGKRSGWLHDLSRRDPDATPGTMELIVASAIETFKSEGVPYLHFGLTPFTGLAADHELGASSCAAGACVRFLGDHGRAVYPAADQLAYKMKWCPDVVLPEYIAFSGRVSIRAIWSLLRLTNAA
jgi:lysylphosphatidylglycerol synthetase-like protein (DUF2156 family)